MQQDKTETSDRPKAEGRRGPIQEAGLLGRMVDRAAIVFAIGILASALVLNQEVLLRYVFNAPTIWAHETTVFLCAVAFLFGGLYCTSHNSHIRVVLLYDLAKGRAKSVLDLLISLICMGATVFFSWAAWMIVERAVFRPGGGIRLETSGSAWDPAFPAGLKIFLFVVLVLLSLQFLVLAFNFAHAAFVGSGKQE